MKHHLAILYRTYVDEIVAGRKTVECRLGETGFPPFSGLEAGDLIWLKEVSGPVRAVATARSVRRFDGLTPETLELIRREWNGEIRGSAEFWKAGRWASVATLIWLGDICSVEPFAIKKRDRRAWVVLGGPPIPGQMIRESSAKKSGSR